MATRNDISFFCNFCGQKVSIHESRVGTTVECPGCRSYIPVPSREELDLGPAPAKRDPLPINTKKITVRIKSPPEGTPPRPPAPPTARPASSSNSGVMLRNWKWLVIPVLTGLVIVGASVIVQRQQQPPSSGAKVKPPVIDENRRSVPLAAGPEERMENKTPPPADSADTDPVLQVERNNLLANESLSGTGLAPDGWSSWNNDNHDTDKSICRSAGNSWVFWWDGGIYQDATSGFSDGSSLLFGGHLYTPSADALRNGTKHGVIQLEFYNGDLLISTHSALPTISSKSLKDEWILSQGTAAVPANATKARVVVKCNDWTSGDGVFRADDVFLSTH